MYKVVHFDWDHCIDARADVLGCVVSLAIVKIADATAQMSDKIAYVFLEVVSHVEPTTLQHRGTTSSPPMNGAVLLPSADTALRRHRDGIMVAMDAGIAAVLGAGVGTLGVIVTGWTARSAAKMQMRNESLRGRREPRRASYEAFSSAATTLHDHLQPWVHFGRLLDRSRTSDDVTTDATAYLRHSEFKDGYADQALTLADDVSQYGRHVVLDGPAELEPFVAKVTELSSDLVAPFRILLSFARLSDGVSDSTVAYDTSQFPEKLKQLDHGVREFLQHASTALDRDVAS
ncbi:hypothetical protein [Streptomyces sp. NPDC017868]|uniref:hypothetical protein n=1 Tax=Streptomyces sp. NPDC017868 TaxID=3365014 RepID=UPI00379F5C7F